MHRPRPETIDIDVETLHAPDEQFWSVAALRLNHYYRRFGLSDQTERILLICEALCQAESLGSRVSMSQVVAIGERVLGEAVSDRHASEKQKLAGSLMLALDSSFARRKGFLDPVVKDDDAMLRCVPNSGDRLHMPTQKVDFPTVSLRYLVRRMAESLSLARPQPCLTERRDVKGRTRSVNL